MTNRLKNEVSPYLLQHADNPVDWYPWSDEAIEKARRENKPIFLSIGYAACHWCHVMERESFEDPEIAALLNEHFVSIKVDREERPDLDNIYMNAVVAMTGQGGWPMSIFLTPDGRPFYGGTYFPPTRRHGMPAFQDVLQGVIQAWSGDRREIDSVSQRLTQHLKDIASWRADPLTPQITIETLDTASRAMRASYDWQYGGWGKAPKFPQPMAIEYLLLQSTRGDEHALKLATHALDAMQRGGMYDVVGGGFHRYSTDSQWMIPHFEKMLYDNAQLALVYLHAYMLTLDEDYLRTCTKTLDFVARELRDPAGGFYSSLDADVNGQEGVYYLWSEDQITELIEDPLDRRLFTTVYPISQDGNFEGTNVLHRQRPWPELAEDLGIKLDELRGKLDRIEEELLKARQKRTPPATDDKVLVSWNALMLQAFAEAGRYLQRNDYLEIAQANANFLLSELHSGSKLLRSWRRGQARHSAYLEDYASLIIGLLTLYQADFNLHWYTAAVTLAEEMVAGYRDPEGGFFDTRPEADLILRPKEIQDNATPSGNSLAAYALLLLSAFDKSDKWREMVEPVMSTLRDTVLRHPTAFAYWLQAMDFMLGPIHQIALIVPSNKEAARPYIDLIGKTYRPRTVLACSEYPPPEGAPYLLSDRPVLEGHPTVYICEEFVCLRPITDLAQLQTELELTT